MHLSIYVVGADPSQHCEAAKSVCHHSRVIKSTAIAAWALGCFQKLKAKVEGSLVKSFHWIQQKL